jgi:hypothetical protein
MFALTAITISWATAVNAVANKKVATIVSMSENPASDLRLLELYFAKAIYRDG